MSGDDLAAVVDLGVIKRIGIKDALIDHAPNNRDLLLKLPDHVSGGIADPVEPVNAPEHGLVAEQTAAATYPQNISVGAPLVAPLGQDKVVLHLWLPNKAPVVLNPLVNTPVKPITVQDTV